MSATTIARSDAHEYTVGGRPFVGVTTVIGEVIRKKGLERWIGDLGNAEAERVRNTAASHGTLVHALAALVVEGVPSIPMDDEDAPTTAQVAAFTAWYEQYVEVVHAVELQVASERYQYAGTLDLLLRMKGDKRPTLVDIKSGKAVYQEAKLQCIAYMRAVQNMGLLKHCGYKTESCRRGVLHIPRDSDGPARFYEYTQHVSDFTAFLSALFIYRWQRS